MKQQMNVQMTSIISTQRYTLRAKRLLCRWLWMIQAGASLMVQKHRNSSTTGLHCLWQLLTDWRAQGLMGIKATKALSTVAGIADGKRAAVR